MSWEIHYLAMKNEYIIASALGLFVFGYIIDWLAPVTLSLSNPFLFLDAELISTYPLTAVSVGLKTLGLFLTTLVAISAMFKTKFITAAITLFVIAALAELYSIQQLATNMRLVSIQWTLALAYAGVALIVPSAIYMLLGVLKNIHNNLKPQSKSSDSNDEDDES